MGTTKSSLGSRLPIKFIDDYIQVLQVQVVTALKYFKR